MRIRSLLLVANVALMASCSSDVPVAVTNTSDATLRNVVITGSGFSQAIPLITPGATVATRVHPHGESGISVAFTVDSRRVELPEQGYIERTGSYSATVTVKPDFSVSVVTR